MQKGRATRQALLKGWAAIAKFLGLSPANAQRWAKEGMPIRCEGRFTVADPGELQEWLGRESHMKAPARVMTGDTDIGVALKDLLAVARKNKKRD